MFDQCVQKFDLIKYLMIGVCRCCSYRKWYCCLGLGKLVLCKAYCNLQRIRVLYPYGRGPFLYIPEEISEVKIITRNWSLIIFFHNSLLLSVLSYCNDFFRISEIPTKILCKELFLLAGVPNLTTKSPAENVGNKSKADQKTRYPNPNVKKANSVCGQLSAVKRYAPDQSIALHIWPWHIHTIIK